MDTIDLIRGLMTQKQAFDGMVKLEKMIKEKGLVELWITVYGEIHGSKTTHSQTFSLDFIDFNKEKLKCKIKVFGEKGLFMNAKILPDELNIYYSSDQRRIICLENTEFFFNFDEEKRKKECDHIEYAGVEGIGFEFEREKWTNDFFLKHIEK